jgi:aquaporin Z
VAAVDVPLRRTVGRPRLKGSPDDQARPQERSHGWHWTEWACEYAGTAFQLFVGFSIVGLMEATDAPGRVAIDSPGARLALLGVAFGLLAAVVAVSPIGRRSGAHLNPAVTLAFWARGHTSTADLAGFAAGQTAGALTAAAAYATAWSRWSDSTHVARTAPAAGVPVWAVAPVEAGLTCGLLLVILGMLARPRTARWTPVAVTAALSALIWAGGAVTGASMNPARTIGPDVVGAAFPALWCYVVGPVAGALLAVGLMRLAGREWTTLTAKLFHDAAYPSVHRSHLPAKPRRSGGPMVRSRDGERTLRPERIDAR